MTDYEREAVKRFVAAKALEELYPESHKHPIYREAAIVIEALMRENNELRIDANKWRNHVRHKSGYELQG